MALKPVYWMLSPTDAEAESERPVVASRHDQRAIRERAELRTDVGPWRDDGDVVGRAVMGIVRLEHLRDRDDVLALSLVDGAQPTGRGRVVDDLLLIRVGHVEGYAVVAPHAMSRLRTQDHRGEAGETVADDIHRRRVQADRVERRRGAEVEVRVVGKQRTAVLCERPGDGPLVRAEVVMAVVQLREERYVLHLVVVLACRVGDGLVVTQDTGDGRCGRAQKRYRARLRQRSVRVGNRRSFAERPNRKDVAIAARRRRTRGSGRQPRTPAGRDHERYRCRTTG